MGATLIRLAETTARCQGWRSGPWLSPPVQSREAERKKETRSARRDGVGTMHSMVDQHRALAVRRVSRACAGKAAGLSNCWLEAECSPATDVSVCVKVRHQRDAHRANLRAAHQARPPMPQHLNL